MDSEEMIEITKEHAALLHIRARTSDLEETQKCVESCMVNFNQQAAPTEVCKFFRALQYVSDDSEDCKVPGDDYSGEELPDHQNTYEEETVGHGSLTNHVSDAVATSDVSSFGSTQDSTIDQMENQPLEDFLEKASQTSSQASSDDENSDISASSSTSEEEYHHDSCKSPVESAYKIIDADVAVRINNQGKHYASCGNYKKAIKKWKTAAGLGNPLALYNLGVLHHTGAGVDINKTKATKYFKKAARKGHNKACYNAAINLIECKNNKSAMKYLKKAAKSGIKQAQCDLGALYAEKHRYKEAAEWFRKAADQECAEAQVNLGICYLKGQGVDVDCVKAHYFFKKAVEQGLPEALDNLHAILNESGRPGVSNDEHRTDQLGHDSTVVSDQQPVEAALLLLNSGDSQIMLVSESQPVAVVVESCGDGRLEQSSADEVMSDLCEDAD